MLILFICTGRFLAFYDVFTLVCCYFIQFPLKCLILQNKSKNYFLEPSKMTKNSQRSYKEEAQDEDYSSEDMKTHKPDETDRDLEVDERAYTLLEYLNLEWPAQSISVKDSKIYLGTNPQEGSAELISVDIKDTDYQNLKYKDAKINYQINKIRVGRHIYAIADKHLLVYERDTLKFLRAAEGDFGYGLCVTEDVIYAGERDGYLCKYTHDLELIERVKMHKASIEAIGISDGRIFTGSVDHTLKVSDVNGNVVKEMKNNSDINCLDINGDKLVYGDDDGCIKLVDVRNFEAEEISWHTTPISAVRWKDAEVFASCSDEQVCLWDTSFVDEWDFHKYLLFVHQGQRMYKDVDFDDKRVITTAIEGISIFTPVSFETELE
ncbi:ribosome assembly protein RRB1 [Pancytospora epiphaga]|nr:ribosome assembly protein RRB1 [Pancytospora epiphaga]